MIKTYSQMIQLPTFDERFEYVKLGDHRVGEETFGWRRYLNQKFYNSREWKNFRNKIVLRDTPRNYCCDLGHEDYPIIGQIYIHHLNPIKPEDLYSGSDWIWDPENLVCVCYDTHSRIHYGGEPPIKLVERTKGDTCPWRIME